MAYEKYMFIVICIASQRMQNENVDSYGKYIFIICITGKLTACRFVLKI